MSQPRILRTSSVSYYHAYSRIVDRAMRIGEREKAYFHLWMRRLERFSGVQVVTYCLMSNHFHLLIRVPEKSLMAMLDEARLRKLLPLIYRGRQLADAVHEIDQASAHEAAGDSTWLQEILERYHARRYDLSSFVKDLKQRFTQWYNGRHQRTGTLWEDRFHSVLVEGSENALLTVAAYIDLNPIRAGLVADPASYRWSGYGEAIAGKAVARNGLNAILQHTSFGLNRRVTWSSTGPRYRILLYGHGEQVDASRLTGRRGRIGLSRAAVEAELARGGKLPLAEILRCKVRYFCDGGILGSTRFVDEAFDRLAANNQSPASNRKSGARNMKGAEWGELRSLRDLQKKVFG